MDYKVLYRKYRPKDFANLVGQDYIVTTLKNSIKNNKCSHAYIFSGPRGTGKTSMAKIFAKTINCTSTIDGNPCGECVSCLNFENNPDIIEIDAASNNGVDDIREIINNVKLAPAYSKYKIYIVDEVHMLSQSAFNALLLTLEEPPSHIIFILATTDIQNVPITILSRCQRFDFKKVAVENIIKRLRQIAEYEKISISDEALQEIAYLSEGGMRDALSIMDQLICEEDKEITTEEIINSFGTVSSKTIQGIIESLDNNRVEEIVEEMVKISESGVNYKIFIDKIIRELKNSAIKRKIKEESSNLNFEKIKKLIFELNNCLINVKTSVNPYLLIEITLLSYISDEKSSKPIKINKNEIVENQKSETEENNIKTVEKEKKPDKTKSKDNSLIKVRINNCFVNAKKEYLKEMQEYWVKFKDFLKKNDKELLSILTDSSIVTASDEYAIVSSNLESEVNLINEKLEDLTNDFHKFIKKNYKFIAITNDYWLVEREMYIKNIKNNIKYNLLEEKDEILLSRKSESKIQVVAKEIFGDKLEIK